MIEYCFNSESEELHMNKDLENKILEVANLIYETGYTAGSVESGFDDGFKYGLRAAWEAARKLIHDASNDYAMIDEVFGDCSVDFIIINNSIEDVLSKIKTYENKGTCDKCIHNNKGTCNKCVHTKCNTCVHKNEDNICCGCVNDSEYEKEPGQAEKTEKQPERSCASCAKEYERCNAIDCFINNQSYWIPKPTKDQIKLGDEVIHETGSKGIVVGIDSENFYLLTSDYNVPQEVSKEGYTKTGRYFSQIQELRDQLH